MAANVPTKIGRYDVVGVIGRGGMGVVYKARDPRLDREVAIKMMTGGFADNPDLLKRFFREAQSLGSLQHPNIVTVYELGDYDGNPYLVMQFLEGDGLDTVFSARRQLSLLDKINIVIQVCNGLAYAHQRGVVHRDIKPANIMLCKDGSVKIFDFGIAHIGDQSVTKTGQMIGTPPYMSPEQVNGKSLDTRSDLFSTGVVLYQLLTHHLPFEGDSTANTFLKILYDPPPPLKTFLASYPAELDTIIVRALAKEPSERYHSADEFSLDLGQLQIHLKQEAVAHQMKDIGQLLEKADLYKAKELLVQLLKTDPQHAQGNQLLREVQQRIKKQELGEQVRRLRLHAEEAAAREQFETALECLEQALGLDKNNAELLRLRDSVRTAASRAQKLHNALKLAESAHQDGDLDTAKQAVEEALQIAPDDAQAKALYRVIQRDWVDRSRQRQLENYLFQARQDISSRKFTAALETLKLAEALDPKAPQVHALMESASAGREQERRRKDLEAVIRDVEDALNRDDFRGACDKASEGLSRFPEERTLLKLKALADRQRQVEERRHFIDEQLALARKLLHEGRNEELLTALQAGIQKIGPEPRLQSLLTIVTENVQRERLERRKSEFLQKAKEDLRSKEYDSAIKTLELARKELGSEPEIEDLLQFAKEDAATDKRRRAAEAAAQKAQGFLAEQNYEEAIRLLEATLREAPDEELRIVLAETRRAAVDYQQKVESTVANAEKLLQSKKANEALKLLESQPAPYFRNPALAALLQTAHREAERARRIGVAIERSQQILEAEDYAGAQQIIEECRQQNGTASELDSQLAVINQRRIAAASRIVEKALSDARILHKANEYQGALDKLGSVDKLVPDLAPELRSEYDSLRKQAATNLVRSRKTQIERFIAGGELTRAGDLLRQSLAQFPDDRNFFDLGKVLEKESQRRSGALENLAAARKAFTRSNWNEGGELLKKAFAAAVSAPSLRDQVLDAFVQAGVSAVESDWRAAETLLAQLAELNSECSPPSVLRSRIRERKQEEFVNRCTTGVDRLLSSGQLQEALREVDACLSTYPDVASLKELRRKILERIWQEEERLRKERTRLEKEAFLREISARVESEPAVDRRIALLDEALERYPQDPTLEQQSAANHELWKRISTIETQVHSLESESKYDEALQQLAALKTIHRLHPGLEQNVLRVSRLREQARAAAKVRWIEQIQKELSASEFDRARSFLLECGREFPGDQDIARLEQQLADDLRLRVKAQKLLVDSSKAFEKQRWEKALDGIDRAVDQAPRDAQVRQQALQQLTSGFDTALPLDIQYAQMLLECIAKIQPASPSLAALRARIQDRKRELAIHALLTRIRAIQQNGDLPEALRELTSAIALYPGDQRFIQAKAEVDFQVQQLEIQREQDREKARELELEREREQERKRQEALERERIRAQEEERKRQEALERERVRAQEAERKRKEEEEQARLRAEQAERERQAALERDRVRAEEAERKRQERVEAERLRAQEAERARKEELERQRILAQEEERKRQALVEQERLRALEREKERERERQRLEAIAQERQQAEKQRLEKERQAREEALQKQEALQRERALAKKAQQEQKEQEKLRKREERERKRLEAAEQRRQEQEAERLRQEQRRQEALKAKTAKVESKLSRPQTGVDELSATKVFGPETVQFPSSDQMGPTEAADAAKSAEERTPLWATFAALEPIKRAAILSSAALLLLLLVTAIWTAVKPRPVHVGITTSPDGAAVTLLPQNGSGEKRECVTPQCNFDLAPGTYGLEIRHEGYQEIKQTIEVSKSTHSFPIALFATPPPPLSKPTNENTSARLEVRGLPAGSQLEVDGIATGKVGSSGEISAKVSTGPHQIKIVAKNRDSVIVSRTFEAGRVVSLTGDDFRSTPPSVPALQPAPEEVDWKTTQGSASIEAVEQYLKKYPNGSHTTEASAMLEGLYWAKDSEANSIEAYRDYLHRFPNAQHVAAAEEEVAFLEARNDTNLSSLEAFVGKYPSSRHRSEIEGRRDDLTWQQTNKTDEKSINSYLRSFSKARHSDEARSQLAQITALEPSRPSSKMAEISPSLPAVDERHAILAVLVQYKKAYEDENIGELVRLGPGTGNKKAFESFFKQATSVKWEYALNGDPKIEGDHAAVNIFESLSYVLDKRQMTQQKKTTMYLQKSASGAWVIESIQRN